jgi:hypothetical protein
MPIHKRIIYLKNPAYDSNFRTVGVPYITAWKG